MATGVVSWSQTAANNATADSTVNWQENQAPSSINDSARAEMASVAKYRDDLNGSLTTGGTSTAYTLTTNQGFASLSELANQELAFTMHTTSGATPTLAVDSLTAKPIRNATGATLPTGALLSGSVYHVTYNNSTGEFLLRNQPGVLPSSSVATSSIADDAVTFAKMQNLSQNQVIGRYSSGSGDPQALTLSSGLSVDGSGNVTTSLNPTLVPNYLSGLTLSTAGSSTTMSIAVGAANDSTNTTLMKLGTALNKTTASWSGGDAGGLDTGSIANNTWYHFYLIERTDTGNVDVVFSTSASSPTLPTNYTLYRRIGSGKTNSSGQWLLFAQAGDTFIWSAAVLDANNASIAASRTTTALSVPTGVVVSALFRATLNTGATHVVAFFSPQESDQSVSATNGIGDLFCSSAGGASGSFARLTNTSAQVSFRGSSSSTGLFISTYGWIDTRGK